MIEAGYELSKSTMFHIVCIIIVVNCCMTTGLMENDEQLNEQLPEGLRFVDRYHEDGPDGNTGKGQGFNGFSVLDDASGIDDLDDNYDDLFMPFQRPSSRTKQVS